MGTEKDLPCRVLDDSGHPLLRMGVELPCLRWRKEEKPWPSLESLNLGWDGNSLLWPLVFTLPCGVGNLGGQWEECSRGNDTHATDCWKTWGLVGAEISGLCDGLGTNYVSEPQLCYQLFFSFLVCKEGRRMPSSHDCMKVM